VQLARDRYWTASARPAAERNAIERARDAFAPFAREFVVQTVRTTADGTTWVAGDHKDGRSLLLRDRPVTRPCTVTD
jgi:hypothetical protein